MENASRAFLDAVRKSMQQIRSVIGATTINPKLFSAAERLQYEGYLRREGRQQSGLDARLVPPDKETAYRVARMVEEELGWEVVGWKIAARKEGLQRQLRTDSPIYGRVFGPLKYSPATVEYAMQCSPIPEVECQARLGADLPPRVKPYSIEEVTEAVVSLHPGIELAECRFMHDAAFPPLTAILADGPGGGAVVCGSPIEDWRWRDVANQEVVLTCDGVQRRKGTVAEALNHPMVPLTWLANELSRTGIGLKAGQYRHADWHAAAEAGRDLRRGLRPIRESDRLLCLIIQNLGRGWALGTVKYPLPETSDYASFLLKAQSSGAEAIGFTSAGAESWNPIERRILAIALAPSELR